MIEKRVIDSVSMEFPAPTKLDVYADSSLGALMATIDAADLVTNETTEVTSTQIVDYIDSVPEYHELQREQVTDAVNSIRHLLDLVKNTIGPHICRVLHRVTECLGELGDVSEMPWNIVEVNPPELLTSGAIAKLIQPFANSPVMPGSTSNHGILRSGSDLDVDLVRSFVKLTDQDGLNQKLAAAFDEDNGFVYGALSGRFDVLNVGNFPSGPAIATLVIAVNMKTPPAGIADVSLSEWETRRTRLINHLSKRLLKLSIKYRSDVDNKVLYAAPISKTYDISVNSEVYRQFVDKGLTPEALIGNEVMGRKFMGVQLLNPQVSAECTAAAKVDLSARRQATSVTNQSNIQQVISQELRQDLLDIAENESWPVAGDTREKAWARLKSVVDKVFSRKGNVSEKPDDLVAAIILTTWYAHTDAWRLYQFAADIENNDPELDSEEIMTLAKLRYVAAYVAASIHVSVNQSDDNYAYIEVERSTA